MGTKTCSAGRRAAAVLAAVIAGSIIVACGGGSAAGFDQPPASLDAGSPTLLAQDIAYDRAELAVRARAPFILVFENRDTISHNVSIYADEGLRDRRFEGVLFGGPGTRWYPIPALAPGTYLFACDLHPSMRGRLVAG